MHLKRAPSARQMAVTELDLVSFTSLVRGIKFYNVSTSAVRVGGFVSLCSYYNQLLLTSHVHDDVTTKIYNIIKWRLCIGSIGATPRCLCNVVLCS